ncbi:MAG: hypothetical protein DRJ65_12215 [Acidobacteria bacterium]|nr:MAG: hypothetical protein DRJ65_12215 [Acidobacteriota bacterium]
MMLTSFGNSLAGGPEIPAVRLFDIVPSAISIQNRDMRITAVNETFRRLFGDRVGELCYDVYKGRSDVCVGCPLIKTFQDGEIHVGEETVRTVSGETILVAVQTAPIFDDDGRIVGGMEVVTDISKTTEMRQELVMLGQAMAGMAHYIKNVLTGLEGGVFVVEEGMEAGDEDLVQQGWTMVRRNIDRVMKLSRDQLYCARERPMERAPVPVKELVCEAVKLYEEKAASDGVELLISQDPQLETGWLDSEGFYNLLTNLISNAVDACRFETSRERHWVQVSTLLEPGGQLRLEVADNGRGIPKELCGEVFSEMFTTKGSGGTGLGLLVVYRVVCAHRGQITVLSEEGVGTVFTIILPLDK